MASPNRTHFLPGNPYLLSAILILPALLLYFKTLKFDFTSMDEQWMILQNQPYFEKEAGLFSVFSEAMGGQYYRPVLQLSFYLNYKVGGLSPASFHLFNLIIHLTNILLLFQFLRLIHVERTVSAFCAFLFSVHPVLLHAVAWVPGRNDMLLALFFLASAIHLAKYLHENRTIHLVYHLLFYVCALFTKENAVVFPLIYAAFIFLLSNKTSLKTKGVLGFAWIVLLSLFLVVYFTLLPDKAFSGAGKFSFINFMGGLCLFAGKLIAPVQLSVLPRLTNQSVWPGIISFLFIAALFFRPGFKNKKLVLFGLTIFVTILSIPLWFGTVRGGEHYEQRLYLPLCGFLLMISQLELNFHKKSVRIGAIALLLTYFIISATRMPIYKNKEVFITHAVKECPDFYLFNLQMGEMLCNRQKYSEALPYLNEAERLRPNSFYILNVRGTAYYQISQFDKAIEDFTRAIQLSKFDERLYLNRCLSYLNQGNYIKAADDMVTLKKAGSTVLPRDVQEEIMGKLKAGER